ncbi:MAG TPA: hypothetical protein PKI59_07250, partial [Candidatus Cloacimonadota bacterium]|nr:hypothetical protein [Candidatus Cloacimonadota bacterium]
WEEMCRAWPGNVVSTNPEVKASNHTYASPHEDFIRIIQNCQALLCKPGYGSFSEAVQFAKPIIYVPRANYPEERVLLDGLKDYPAAYKLSHGQLTVKQWQVLFRKVLKAGKIPARDNDNLMIAGCIIAAYIKARYREDRIFTVCDLGTNNMNMCLYNKSREQVIHKVTLVSGVGKHVRRDKITAQGLQQARKQLRSALEIDKGIKSHKYLIATGVFREVGNSDDLLAWFREDYGYQTKVISAKREANYASIAGERNLEKQRSRLIVDIGGYSTEFIYTSPEKRRDNSLKLGLLGLKQLSDHSLQSEVGTALQTLDFPSPESIVAIGLSASLLIKAIDHKTDFEMMSTPLSEYTRGQLQDLQQRLLSRPKINEAKYPALRALASIYLLILDRFGLNKILVSGDGISIGFAQREK